MKKLLLIFSILLSFSGFAKEKDLVKCTLNLRPAGVWFNQCPPRMVADGVDVWNPGPSPFPQVRVTCVIPEIICESKNIKVEYVN